MLLLGCKAGEDYQCHFIRGSELLQTRMDNVRETLSRLMLEPERAEVMEVAISDFDTLPARLGQFVESIKAIGLEPHEGLLISVPSRKCADKARGGAGGPPRGTR